MAKKVKKKKAKPVNKELVNKIRYLNILVDCSMKQVKNDDSTMDSIFKNQASKLLDEIKKLEENQ